MTDKVQLIKEEIERLKNEQLSIFSKGENDEICGTALICIGVYNQLLSFINSFSEEPTSEDTCLLGHDYKNRDCENCSFELCKRFSKPASEDLEEEIEFFWNSHDGSMNKFEYQRIVDCAHHFAEWQKQKMMKNVVLETEVLMDCDGDGIETPYEEWLTLEDTEIPCVPDGFKDGDIVKVILVKEDLP